MQYSLDMLGRRFRLSVPFELHIGPSMAPFLHPAQGEGGQFHILVRPGYLPLPGENSIWHETGYYEHTDHYLRVLRCQGRGESAYAMVEMDDAGNIRVTYRPEFVQFFKNAADLVQHIGLERLLLHHDCLILHASFIAKQGRGILFSAPSGTGKSTQAALWRTARGYEILNGDRAGICLENGRLQAWGLPYAGSSGIYRNESAQIGAVVVLRQGNENSISRLTPAAAIRHLYPETTIHHWAERFIIKALDLLQSVTQTVPVYLLTCQPNEDAVILLEQTLVKEGIL